MDDPIMAGFGRALADCYQLAVDSALSGEGRQELADELLSAVRAAASAWRAEGLKRNRDRGYTGRTPPPMSADLAKKIAEGLGRGIVREATSEAQRIRRRDGVRRRA